MRHIQLRDGNEIPILGLGTWQLRGEPCIRVVKEAIQIGYRHIDTADGYDNHKQIQKGIHGFDRKTLFITTKLWYDDLDQPVQQVNRFLEELGVDYLDVVLLHWPKNGKPMAEGLIKISEMESVRSVGVSNFTIQHLEEVIRKGVQPVINQVEFHPFLNQQNLLNYCKQHGIVVTAYSPLARGEVMKDATLQEISKAHHASEPQVALSWLMSKDIVVIPKASSKNHLENNYNALELTLREAEITKIDQLNQGKRLINPSFAEFNHQDV